MHRVKIHQGDITKLEVDAIVCASEDCIGFAANNLSAEFVIHTLGPVWRGGDQREEEQLAYCYNQIMDVAKQQNIKSIAFPAISCGVSGFPTRSAVKIAIREVNQALRQNPLLESVVFCCFDPVTTALYRTQVGK